MKHEALTGGENLINIEYVGVGYVGHPGSGNEAARRRGILDAAPAEPPGASVAGLPEAAGTMTGRPPGDPMLSVITLRPGPGVVRVLVAGEVDLATAPRLQTALLAAVAAAPPPAEVQVDLAEVRFLDAVGIGVLVRGREAARRTGLGFSAYNARGIVLRVLEVVGLADVFLVRGRDLTT